MDKAAQKDALSFFMVLQGQKKWIKVDLEGL